jgi:hypothetical protein
MKNVASYNNLALEGCILCFFSVQVFEYDFSPKNKSERKPYTANILFVEIVFSLCLACFRVSSALPINF